MIGLNRHWQSVDWREGEKPLVVHYAGCSFCSPPTDKITEKQVRSSLATSRAALRLVKSGTHFPLTQPKAFGVQHLLL